MEKLGVAAAEPGHHGGHGLLGAPEGGDPRSLDENRGAGEGLVLHQHRGLQGLRRGHKQAQPPPSQTLAGSSPQGLACSHRREPGR